MADELELHFVMPDRAEDVHRAWRADAPRALAAGGFDQVDESYNSITYEASYYDWPQKLLFVTTCGFALLFKGFMASNYKVTARFDEDGSSGTRVTITGKADPGTRARLGRLAAEHGGPAGTSFGV